ncbi:MAG: T9SS type A sorting domain-containing protein [Bacteroidetes bacterium]|nr:T9SS type A sorting domain-containing protein [Bacteroidota bacterium]
MKLHLYISGLLLLISTHLFASYSVDWLKTADGNQKSGTMIARDKSDNLFVTGYRTTQNIYTRKYDKFGNLQWEKTDSSGIHSIYQKPGWINCDKNKNVFVVGYQYAISSGWEYPSALVVLKYNTSGALQWRRTINLAYVVGSSTGYSFNLRSEVDNNGNIFIGTAGTSPAGFVLVKINPTGTILFNTTLNLGGIHQFASMRLKGNKVLIVGRVSINLNAAVMAWDTSGSLLWNNFYTGFGARDVEMDGSGNVFLLTSNANQVSPTSGQDAVIYKLNASGTQLWKKKYDFGGQEYPTRFTFVSGKLSIIGYCSTTTYFDWITFQTNSSGTLLWGTKYNGTLSNDEIPYAIAAKANGEVFVTGKGGPMFTQVNGSSYLRMVTLKYGSTGAMQWLDTLNIYNGWGTSCTLASDSSLYVMGGTNMTAIHYLDHTGTGSCGIPSGMSTSNVTDSSAKFSWSPVPGAYLYHLRYKTSAAAAWTILSTNQTSKTVKTLVGGTVYNYAVEAICNSGPSGYSSTLSFSTLGTGYCATGGMSTAQEFLNLVWIGGIVNQTMSNNGYADFTNLSTPLQQGATINGFLSGASTPWGLLENYSIWIDYNHDFDFTDAGEQVVSFSSDLGGYIGVNFTVPTNAVLGTTRMRVSMNHGIAAGPCGMYTGGETEDYTVIISTPLVGAQPSRNGNNSTATSMSIYPNPSSEEIHFATDVAIEGIACIRVYAALGNQVLEKFTESGSLYIGDLPEGYYMVTLTQLDKVYTSKFVVKR